MRRLILALIFALAAPTLSAQDKIARRLPDKSAAAALPATTPVGRIVIKFHEGTQVRRRAGVLQATGLEPEASGKLLALGLDQDRVAADVEAVTRAAAAAPGRAKLRRLFTQDEEALDLLKRGGEAASGRELADLNLYFELPLPAGTPFADTRRLLRRLNALASVEIAYAEPVPRPASVKADPTTPDFQPQQGYLNPAPQGIDALFAWTQPGGRGQGVKIVDIEGGFRESHEDLPPLFHKNGDAGTDVEHGTAVLGELVAIDDGHGVTGVANQAQAGFESATSQSIASAVIKAAAVADVVLIEQQTTGPLNNLARPDCLFPPQLTCPCLPVYSQCDLVPVEINQATFDAIATATANGKLVVEAAGNGTVDLSHPVYGGLFDRTVRDSGAILVGAGESSGGAPTNFTNWGSRVDLRGWGNGVATTGFGELFSAGGNPNRFYTASFGGTSSASPIVAGAAAILVSAARSASLPISPRRVRQLLADTGTPQGPPLSKNIGPLPNLQAAFALLPDQPPVAAFTVNCQAKACTFNAGGSTDDHGIQSFTWAFGDGTTGAGQTPSHTYNAAGTFTVELTVTDGAGQEGTTQRSAVTQDEFSLALSPSSVTIPAGGGPAVYTVSITRNGGFAGPVALSVSGLPFEGTASFSPNPATGTASTLAVNVTAQTLNGTTTLVVTGTGATPTISKTATASLVNNLQCPMTFTPPSASVGSAAATYSVAVAVHANCAWRAQSEIPFLTIHPDSSSGTGNGTVVYSVSENTGTKSRSGPFQIGKSSYTVTQAAFANPAPTISTISPVNVTAGGPGFTLTVFGSGFTAASVVQVGGKSRTTTLVNMGVLTAAIPATDVAVSGTRSITVFNPAPGGGTSNAATLNVNANPNHPVPSISAVAPTSVTAGGSDFTLTVDGAGFFGGSVVRFNGLGRTTTFVSSTRLTALIRSTDIVSSGTAAITVFNSAPGGGLSNAVSLTIDPQAQNPVPTVASLAPTSVTVGSGTQTLTVNGSGFVAGAVVRVNGSDRLTSFVGASQLTATLPSTDFISATTLSITVFHPAPGGGVSNEALLSVVPNPGNPVPTIGSLSPSSVVAGSGALTLTVNGNGFVSGSVVRYDGSNRTTTFVSPTKLTASLPAGDVAAEANHTVTVFTPAPGGGLSNALTFRVTTSATSPPAAPTNLAASAQSTSQIRLTWIDNSNNETGFNVYRKTGVNGSYAHVATAPANATDFTDAGLAAATTYVYQLRAANTIGLSAPSNEASATTFASSGPPAAPTDLSAIQSNSGSWVEVSWMDNSGDETSFRLEKRLSFGVFQEIAVLGLDENVYVDSDVTSGTTYIYRARACNAAGCSAYSLEGSVTPLF